MPTDRAISLGLDLARLDAGTRVKVISLLKSMEKQLIARYPFATDWGKARIDQQLKEAEMLIKETYDLVSTQVAEVTTGVAEVTALSAATDISKLTQLDVVLSKMDEKLGLKLVTIDVAKFDAAFSRDSGFYVGPGGVGGIAGRYDRVRAFINENNAIEASSVVVNQGGSVGFENGRHRYAAIRDSGATRMVVAMDQESISNAKQSGYLLPQAAPVVSVPGLTPSEAVISALAQDSLILGAPMKAWWEKQSLDTAFRYTTAIRQGLIAAETNQQIIRRVKLELEITRRNASALVQTSIQTISNTARMTTFEQNSDVVSGLRWLSTLDSKTCTKCGPRDGMTWKMDHSAITASLPFANPPLHYNCLTGDSLVSSTEDVTGVSKRWFDGEVRVIYTSGGRKFTCTPNHPILSDGGWVASGLIDVGSHIICDSFSERRATSDSYHKNTPTTIHDFVEAFLSSRKVFSTPVPVTPRDFHGDGVGSQVAVIYSEGLLGGGLYSSLPEHVGKTGLIARGSNMNGGFSGFGRLLKSTLTSGLSLKKVMGRLGQIKSLLRSAIPHPGELLFSFGSSSNSLTGKSPGKNGPTDTQLFGNTGEAPSGVKHPHSQGHVHGYELSTGIHTDQIESADNGLTTDAQVASDLIAGHSGRVFKDEVIRVDIVEFHGYVYNLETNKGWYSANGIITHNCRCVLVPQTRFSSLGSGQRASIDGPVDRKTTFTDFLDRKGVAFQDEVLGKGRADLYRAGKITLSDLVSGNGRPLTLQQLRSKYE